MRNENENSASARSSDDTGKSSEEDDDDIDKDKDKDKLMFGEGVDSSEDISLVCDLTPWKLPLRLHRNGVEIRDYGKFIYQESGQSRRSDDVKALGKTSGFIILCYLSLVHFPAEFKTSSDWALAITAVYYGLTVCGDIFYLAV